MQSGDNKLSEGMTYGIESRYFITPKISISAIYTHFSPKEDVDEDGDDILDIKKIEVSLMMRF